MRPFASLAAACALLGAWAGSASPSRPHPRDCRVVMRPGPVAFTAGVRLVHEGNPYPDSTYLPDYRDRSGGWDLEAQPLITLPRQWAWSLRAGAGLTPGMDVESEPGSEKTAGVPYVSRDGVFEWSQAVYGATATAFEQILENTDCAAAGPRLEAAWDGALESYARAIEAHLAAYARVRMKAYLKSENGWKTRLIEFPIVAVRMRCFRPGGPAALVERARKSGESGRIDLGAPWDQLGCRATMDVDLSRSLGYEDLAL